MRHESKQSREATVGLLEHEDRADVLFVGTVLEHSLLEDGDLGRAHDGV
jgi:hypothetical protein